MADIIDNVKEVIKEGEEAVEEIAEEVIEEVKKITKKKPSRKKDVVDEVASEKEAEAESTDEKKVESLEEKKKKLLAKAKELKEKMSGEGASSEELKEEVEKSKKKKEMLIPLEEYVKSGIYIGTRAVTPDMKKYVYRRRADGLAIFNTDIIDEKIQEGIEFLAKFKPEEIIVVCKREAGWRAVKMFSELTGVRVFTKKYPAGILTNTDLKDFFETELTITTDAWVDKNALQDTLNVGKQVMMICDTNNFAKGASQIIIGNNKSSRSIGLIYYLLARGYMKAREMDTSKIPDIEWWVDEE